MSNEARITAGLDIRNGNFQYAAQPISFSADVAGIMGPVPGAFTAAIIGTDVDLSALTQPAFCRIQNLDTTNFVTVGIWDPEGATFYPLMELLAGETYVLRFSRGIQEEFGTGTGTTGANTNRLRVKADTAACNVLVEAFEV